MFNKQILKLNHSSARCFSRKLALLEGVVDSVFGVLPVPGCLVTQGPELVKPWLKGATPPPLRAKASEIQ